MNRKEFNEWVNDMIKWIDYKRFFTYRLPSENDNVVICYDRIIGTIGVARCHPNDKFDLAWGKAIAIARCVGIEVPKITVEKKLSEMKYGEKFIGPYGKKYYFVAKHPVNIGQCIVLKIENNESMIFRDLFYKMVE